jgi:serine/threonine protein kinase
MGFTEEIIATLMYDVLNAISFMHSRGLVHNTIKLSNIVLDKSGQCFLMNCADFQLK